MSLVKFVGGWVGGLVGWFVLQNNLLPKCIFQKFYSMLVGTMAQADLFLLLICSRISNIYSKQ